MGHLRIAIEGNITAALVYEDIVELTIPLIDLRCSTYSAFRDHA